MPNPSTITHEQSSSRNKHTLIGLAAGCAVIGMATGVVSEEHYASAHPSANQLQKELNDPKHVALKATVEFGFSLPLKGDPNRDPIAVVNPLKLGEHTYGYIDPRIQKAGKIIIKLVEYSGTLQEHVYGGGHSDAYAHEVTTPLARVYHRYPVGPSGDKQGTYYDIVMGDQSGNVKELLHPTPGLTVSQSDQEAARQWGEIAEAGVGEPVYYGK